MKKKQDKGEPVLPPVRIEKLVHGGAGLGFAGGEPVFIPLTVPGDLVVPMKVRRAKGVFFAEPGEFMEYSASRRDPGCPWFGECGGCQWLHMHYADQVKWKAEVVKEAFGRIGKLGVVKLNRIHRSPVSLGYRHRARLHVAGGNAGFFRRRSNTVVAWDRCLLLPDRLNSAISILRSIIAAGTVPAAPLSLEVALSHVDGGLTLHWDLGRESSPSRDLERAAASVENEFAGTGYRAAGQVLLSAGGREQVVRGSALELKVRGSRLKASPGTFYQVNPWVNEVLVERVLDRLRMHGVRNLLDLFCGNGNFSVPAARAGIEIDGVDSSLTGIKDAMVVAGDNCRFHALDAGRFLDEKSGRWNAVLVDPPRAGLTNHVAGRLIALKAGTLVYVSCEPATLARDLALLVKGGYSIRNVELFDMFPQTSHAEVMVEMEGTR